MESLREFDFTKIDRLIVKDHHCIEKYDIARDELPVVEIVIDFCNSSQKLRLSTGSNNYFKILFCNLNNSHGNKFKSISLDPTPNGNKKQKHNVIVSFYDAKDVTVYLYNIADNPIESLLEISIKDGPTSSIFENSEISIKAQNILSKWFIIEEINLVEQLIIAKRCTTRRDLMPYFKKGQLFEQVSLNSDDFNVKVEKTKGVISAKISLGELCLRG